MPALFAYIVAVAIFLGGGYGALNWLAGSGGHRRKGEACAASGNLWRRHRQTGPAARGRDRCVRQLRHRQLIGRRCRAGRGRSRQEV